jgi:hypothetical protein
MRKFLKPLLGVLLCLVLFGGCYLQEGGCMMLSHKYDESRLIGLTRDEVLHRLGPPSFDPKSAPIYTTRPWNDAEDGPQWLGYYQGWATCSITFKDGKVDSVTRSWK